jgi:oligopeptide/dipeptide ABC transporter ATP-binding protein
MSEGHAVRPFAARSGEDGPLLEVRGLRKHFPVTRGLLRRVVGQVRAVDGVSFDVHAGETLGLVGESGCGKSTVGKLLLRLLDPTEGSIRFGGREIADLGARELQPLRRDIQIIFQDPYSSLNPRMRVLDIVGEALSVHGVAKGPAMEAKVRELLSRVGVASSWVHRYPHEFSGGQRQRIGIARALALNPKLIVCDEAVSALDVSIRAQVINLLLDLQAELGLAYLFISHDLSVVRHISDRVAVMYLGEIVELAPTQALFETPAHPYTRALLSSVPWPDPRRRPERVPLTGDVPTPINPPSGCRFHTRCPVALPRCSSDVPPNVELEGGHLAKCWHREGLEGRADFYASLQARLREATAQNSSRPSLPVVTDEHAPVSQVVPSPKERQASDKEPLPRGLAVGLLSALGLGAAIAMVMGHALIALPAGLAAYAGLLPSEQRFSARRYRLFLALAAWLFALSFPIRDLRDERLARAQLAALEDELLAYTKNVGSAPERLSQLGFRLFSIFPDGSVVDPWGTPLHYRAPTQAEPKGKLKSLGPDRLPSADDLEPPERK